MKINSVLLVVTMAFAASQSSAVEYVWNHSEGGDFNTADYWTPAGPPGATDRVVINIPLSGTIFFSQNTQNGQIFIEVPNGASSTDVNLNLLGNTYTLHHDWTPGVNDPAVVIGDSSIWTRVAIVHGVVDAFDCIIARLPSCSAELNLRGDDDPLTEDRWTAFGHGMTIGDAGNGSLWIDHGAIVEHGHGGAGATAGGIGHIVVSDPASLWYCTGYFGLGVRGDGYLNISQGSSARIGRCVMGETRDLSGDPNGAYGRGFATINGENSTWELLSDSEVSLVIGNEGDASVLVQNEGYLHSFGHVTIAEKKQSYGELTVQNGGMAEIEKSLSLGRGEFVDTEFKAIVHVEGIDSRLLVNGRGAGDLSNPDPGGDYVGLLVGKSTHALLEVVDGGYVANEYITLVGGEANGEGEIVVDGMNTHLHNKYRLEIGQLGLGVLSIGNGGLVSVTTENSDPDLDEGAKGIVEIGQNAPGFVYVGGHDSNDVPSSLVASAQIKVGVENYGHLEIVGGARVESHAHLSSTNSAAILGVKNDGDGKIGIGFVKVEDAGSLWTHDGSMTVGYFGTGNLEILNGGRVESGNGVVARYAGSTGSATISGIDSVWTIGDTLVVGGDATNAGGTGDVTVSDYGRIELLNSMKIWPEGSLSIDPTATISADFIEMAGGVLAGSGTIEPDLQITSLARILTPLSTDEIAINGEVSDIGDLLKEGPGVLTIKGNAHYQGLTMIADGAIRFNCLEAELHDIIGGGTLGVGTYGTPTMLSATSIQVATLNIGTGFGGMTTVPEPSACALLLISAMVYLMVFKKRIAT